MSRTRLNIFLQHDHAKRIDELAITKRVSKSSVVATALAAFFSPESADRREGGVVRRLERVDQRLDHIERDQTILIEAFAMFLRHHFSITPPVPDAHQDAARAQGRARFEQFVQQLGRHLQRGQSFARDLSR